MDAGNDLLYRRDLMKKLPFAEFGADYVNRLIAAAESAPLAEIERLAAALIDCWRGDRQFFIFGNGGSAGNAVHLANDFLYGVSQITGHGLRVHALSANTAVISCLANDQGYENIFANQLEVLAQPGDVALALTGSGNSPNILRALELCKASGVTSFAVLGYSGGQAKDLADVPIHVAINDMQISEDLQLIIGHMLMQWLYEHRDEIKQR